MNEQNINAGHTHQLNHTSKDKTIHVSRIAISCAVNNKKVIRGAR